MGTDSADRVMNSRRPGQANEWLGAEPEIGEGKVKVVKKSFYVQIVSAILWFRLAMNETQFELLIIIVVRTLNCH